jgi:hypothetical protein
MSVGESQDLRGGVDLRSVLLLKGQGGCIGEGSIEEMDRKASRRQA